MRINFSAAVVLSKALYQRGCYVPGASIVLLSSVAAHRGYPAKSAYCASKAALEGFCRSLAVELARDRVRINCVAPGMVRSEMLDQARETLPEGQLDVIQAQHPLGLGTPVDVAGAIAFLLADTGKWITGTTFVVDGGCLAQ
jgi:NAD(P)-dependent dehydrogenase (short-subunit alcohol dehydrogenase family)